MRLGSLLTAIPFIFSVFVMSAAFADAVTPGSAAPDFSLSDTNGNLVSLADFKGKYVVLEWFNHDCPFVKKHYDSGNMQSLQKAYTEKGVIWLSINSSAPGNQGHYTPDKANELTASKQAAPSAVLLDPDGKVGKSYDAQTTPHIFVINPEGFLIYQGAIDDKPSTDQSDIAPATNYLKQALEEALAGSPVSTPSTKSYGCSVKY